MGKLVVIVAGLLLIGGWARTYVVQSAALAQAQADAEQYAGELRSCQASLDAKEKH